MQTTKPKPTPASTVASDPEQNNFFLPGATGQGLAQPGSSGQAPAVVQASSSLFGDSTVTGAYHTPPEPNTLDTDPPLAEPSYSEDHVVSSTGYIYMPVNK